MEVLIVGSNPAQASPDNSAFHPSTRSRKVIDSWFEGIEAELTFINISNEKTPENRPLNVSEISKSNEIHKQLQSFKNHKIVAVGNAAGNALKRAGIDFLAMPHPSGRNRLLNDPAYVQGKIKQLRDYLSCTT